MWSRRDAALIGPGFVLAAVGIVMLAPTTGSPAWWLVAAGLVLMSASVGLAVLRRLPTGPHDCQFYPASVEHVGPPPMGMMSALATSQTAAAGLSRTIVLYRCFAGCGLNQYRMLPGTWTLDQVWGAHVVEVPTVSGSTGKTQEPAGHQGWRVDPAEVHSGEVGVNVDEELRGRAHP